MIRFHSCRAVGLLALVAVCAVARAQRATPVTPAPIVSAKAIGSAPANSKQQALIDAALSAKTRQTLQAAMDSAKAPATTHDK